MCTYACVSYHRSILFFKYAELIKDPGMYPVNFLGCVLNSTYLLCYYIYEEDKVKSFLMFLSNVLLHLLHKHRINHSILFLQAKVIKQVGKAVVFFGSILLYVNMEDPKVVLFRFGIITTALMLLLIASPLLELVCVVINSLGSVETQLLLLHSQIRSFRKKSCALRALNVYPFR